MANALTVQQIAELALTKKPQFNIPWRPALQQYAASYSAAVVGCSLVDPCMIAAIVNRETGGRNVLEEGVPPGPGAGIGICQITAGPIDWSNMENPIYPGYGALLDPTVNCTVAAHLFLQPALQAFPGNHHAAFAAYNLGIGGVQQEIANGQDPDTYTTNGNYGSSVFIDWINFNAASMGLNVEWSSYTP